MDSRLVIGDLPYVPSRANCNIHSGLGHIDAYVGRFLFHVHLL